MARRRVVLSFPPELTDKPITYRLVRDYGLSINILRAKVTPKEEGRLVLDIENSDEGKIEQGIEYLRSQGVKVYLIAQEIRVNGEECVDCGACTAVCSSGALRMDRESWELTFDHEKCTMCELCVHSCPVGAIEAAF